MGHKNGRETSEKLLLGTFLLSQKIPGRPNREAQVAF